MTIQYNWTKTNGNGKFTINSISWVPSKTLTGPFAQTKKITVTSNEVVNNLNDSTTSYGLNSDTTHTIGTKTINSNSQYITISFNYSYTDSDNVRYFISIPNIKVYSYSKYENNIVFTKEGFKEFATTVKKYPIIHIESTTAGEWASTNGQPNIKIFYGDPSVGTAITCTRKLGGTNTNISASYKYIPVGSNINFNTFGGIQTINESPLNSDNQASGTFRITINNDTYEIPIKGFTSTTSNKPIYIKTSDTTTGVIVTSSKIKLDGNTINTGNLGVTGNISATGTLSVTGATTLYNTLTLGNSSTS